MHEGILSRWICRRKYAFCFHKPLGSAAEAFSEKMEKRNIDI